MTMFDIPLTEADITMKKEQSVIFTVELWQYDYVGDSRRPYWHQTGCDPMFVTATQTEMTAWLDERNAAIVAARIVELEEQIESKQTSIGNVKKKNALIDGMTSEEIIALGVMKLDASVIPRIETEIENLRKKIDQLETCKMETIIDFGYVKFNWTAEPLDIKTIAELNKEID